MTTEQKKDFELFLRECFTLFETKKASIKPKRFIFDNTICVDILDDFDDEGNKYLGVSILVKHENDLEYVGFYDGFDLDRNDEFENCLDLIIGYVKTFQDEVSFEYISAWEEYEGIS